LYFASAKAEDPAPVCDAKIKTIEIANRGHAQIRRTTMIKKYICEWIF
jgi:hypothetical protein